jgi:hypothetical protein
MGRRSYRKGRDKKEEGKPSAKAEHSFFSGKQPTGQSFFSPATGSNDPVQKAMQTNGEPIPAALKTSLGNFLHENLDEVSIHHSAASQQAAGQMQARAFTIGNQVHLGTEGLSLSGAEKDNLLAHEIVHTVQQREASMQNNLSISQPQDSQETEAQSIAGHFSLAQSTGSNTASKPSITKQNSAAIHRDIKDSKELKFGTMTVDFTKSEAEIEGQEAREIGLVKFRPNDKAPESDAIRMVQIVRVIDSGGDTTKAGQAVDWSKIDKGEEADRNKVYTKADKSKGVEADFFVDHFAKKADPRTKHSDAEVSPYFNAYGPGSTGKKKGDDIKVASVRDRPGSNKAFKYSFVTAAKAEDTGAWYGTALWSFDVYTDKGKAKIKNEKVSFREERGTTVDAALETFNKFYKNPGTADAP